MNHTELPASGLLALLDRHAGGRVVWTPQVEELGLAVSKWMSLGLPGGAAYGQQRCGKTMALRFLKGAIGEYIDMPIAVFIWNIGESMRPASECSLLRRFLDDSGCKLHSHRDRAILITRLVDFVAQCCETRGMERILLLVDEAQNIHFSSYGLLIEIFNLLERRNFHPFIMLVGQPELALVPETILEENKLHIYGRFFKKRVQFYGADAKNFEMILSGFDCETVRPDGTILQPMSQALFPNRYEMGWRIKNLADPLSNGLQHILSEHKISEFRIPMQDFVSGMRGLLQRLHKKPELFDNDLSVLAIEALTEGGLVDTLSAYVRYQRP